MALVFPSASSLYVFPLASSANAVVEDVALQEALDEPLADFDAELLGLVLLDGVAEGDVALDGEAAEPVVCEWVF
jgi:hypothetical protein